MGPEFFMWAAVAGLGAVALGLRVRAVVKLNRRLKARSVKEILWAKVVK